MVIPLTCNQPGYQLKRVENPDKPCCIINQCVCNVSLCGPLLSSCSSGYKPIFSLTGCCVKVTCVPETDISITTSVASRSSGGVCIINNLQYTEGQSVYAPDDNCSYYKCMMSNGQLVTVTIYELCEHYSSSDCNYGEEYVPPTNQCCGKCVQKSCVVITANGTAILLNEGKSLSSPDDKCTTYKCVKSSGQLVTVTEKETCQYRSSKDCKYGEEYVPPTNKCCGQCVQKSCVFMTPSGDLKPLKEGESFTSPDDKCTTYKCVKLGGQLVTVTEKETCQYSSSKDCKYGEEYVPPTNQCCGQCVQKSCVVTTANGTAILLNVGESLSSPDDKCTTYKCVKSSGQLVTVTEKETCQYRSSKDCKYGEEYVPPTNQCCGQCVQKSCVVTTTNGTAILLNEGESLSSPDDKCTTYKCVKSSGQLVTVTEKETCQYRSSKDCKYGEEYVPPTNQCCGQCVQKSCVVTTTNGTAILLNEGESLSSPDDKCTTYKCVKSSGQLVTVTEKETCQYRSSKDCKYDEEYVPPTNQCCGQCVKKSCVFMTPSGDLKPLNEGESFSSPGDICTTYKCVKSGGQLFTVTEKETCQYNSTSDCKYGEKYVPPTNQCCGQCVQKYCVFTTQAGVTKLLNESDVFMDGPCTEYQCVNINNQLMALSSTKICDSDCGPGETYEIADKKECCGKCVQISCVFLTSLNKTTTLQPGQSLIDPVNVCIVYTCISVNNQLFTEVEKKTCKYESAQDCLVGEVYKAPSNECCGDCIPSACSIVMSNGTSTVLKPGESLQSLTDKCVSYDCLKSNGTFLSVLNNKTCESVNSEDCETGIIEVNPDGCCSKCKAPKNCTLQVGPVSLLSGDCQLNITIPYCTGSCSYPTSMITMKPECKCCTSLSSSEKTVNAKCNNGTEISYTYDHIEKCGCSTLACV
ncbi:kielin/chordin-like protein isoform X2 [Bufo bufo]|uniref:kielin/chordin-like protein isoform X2 n=1 Tax=Bufo bufo TaxID=8384 RepID=UPI001ABDA944|nr:kielin/chordin-like protein isoform X2 [Bufo bufo]